jgi:hypothetical protein
MGDTSRTVNININYNVNTAGVQKAQQASVAADKATASLRKSTDDLSKSSAKAGTEASKGLKNVETNAKSATKETNALAGSFNGIYGAVKAIIAAGIVRELASITLEAARLSGNFEGVSRAFNKLPNATILMAELQKATKGTVSELELMQKAVQAQNFGIPVQKLGTLLEFATAKAQQTGLSIDYLTNSIVTGLGRKSERIIDNLQLDIAKLRELIAGGLDFRTAAIQLINEDLQKMGGYIETDATKADRLAASFSNLGKDAAVAFAPITRFFIDLVQNGLTGLTTVINAVKNGRSVTAQAAADEAKSQAIIAASQFQQKELTADILKDRQKAADIVQQEINSQQQVIGRNNDDLAALRERLAILNGPLQTGVERIAKQQGISRLEALKIFQAERDRVPELEKAAAFYEFQNIKVAEYQKILKETLKDLTLSTGEDPQLGIIEAKKKAIDGLQQQIEKTRDLGDLGPGGALVTQLEIAQAELADLERAFIEFTKTPKAILDYQNEIKKNLKKNDVHEVTKQLNDEFGNTDEVTKRIEKNIDNIVKGLLKIPTAKPGIADTRSELEKVFTSFQFQQDAAQTIIGIAQDQADSIAAIQLESLQSQLGALRNFYDAQQILAGDNDKAKTALRLKEERETNALQRRIFEKEKEVRRTQAIIDGAAAIIKAFVTAPNVYVAIAQSALIAATTASQIAIINRQQPRFAKGVINLQGPGTETSDSIDAKLSRGESVMTARETRESGGLLKAIRENRINDKLLRSLHLSKDGVQMISLDSEPIVRAIREQKYPDYFMLAGRMYEVKENGKTRNKQIRSKSMG